MSIFQLVKESISFETVAGYYGIEFNRNRKAICPFHDDNTPSFSLHPTGTYARCFSCDKSYDVIELELVLGRHVNKWGAAKALNDRYGLKLKLDGHTKGKAQEFEDALALLEWYCEQAHKALLQTKDAVAWLESNKGISIEDVNEYKIGYVGSGWLREKVTDKSRRIALKLGLLKERDDNINDTFWNRLIFPVYNRNRGKIVSLWTREWPDRENSSYKWLGLPTSEFIPYKPIAFIENLYCDICVVTESIPDALAFLRIGVPSVSIIGNHISNENKVYFEKARAKLYFALDPDVEGRKASHELIKEFGGYELNLGFDKDHDEVLVELGDKEFKKVVEKGIAEAKSHLDVIIENENTLEAIKEIAKLEFAIDREKCLKKLSAKSGFEQKTLEQDLKSILRGTDTIGVSNIKSSNETNINLITDIKPTLHPGMDLIDSHLVYGSKNGDDTLFLYNRKVAKLSDISPEYLISAKPKTNRFSSYGIKTYLNGGEIHGPKLFKRIVDLLGKHLIFKDTWQLYLIATWIFGTYLHRCFPLFPYLWIQSPTKRCGKTRLLELISELGFNSDGIQTAPTEAVLYRLPAITAGTLPWDEAENLYNNKEKGERLEILNAAYRKGAKIARCDGEKNEIKFFEVYRPVALAGISHLPDTVSDRSLKIELIRKRRDEKVQRLQVDRMQRDLQSLRDGLHIFALERTPTIIEAYNDFRDELITMDIDDRLRDAFEILLSIAGGIFRYHQEKLKPILLELQKAAEELSGVRAADETDTSFIHAINVIKDKLEAIDDLVFTTKDALRLFQDNNLDGIKEPEDARKILRRFGVKSESHRISGEVIRGYKVTKKLVEDLYLRYGGA